MIQTTALIGLGAMGVFFAPRMQKALGDERFCVIAGGERKTRLETRGVTVNGENCRFRICDPAEGSPKDLIIMAVKDTGLDQAIRDIEKFVGENTQILCVMNGVESEEKLAAAYGWEHVLYSYMRISIVMKNGVADFNPNAGNVHFGEKENQVLSGRVKDIMSLFDFCSIPYEVDENMLQGLWFKYSCNVGENLTCALLGVPFGAFRVSEYANALRLAARDEVLKIAEAKGIHVPEEWSQKQETVVRKIPAENKPSTLQDLEAGRHTEVDMFAGCMIRMGKELNIPTPVCWFMLQGIRTLEEKNDKKF